MVFFDLHCHPSFKSALLDDDVTKCPTPIDFVDIKISGPLGNCLEKLAGSSLDSQSSFGQIPGGSLVVTNFMAFERVYAFVKDLSRIKNLGTNILQRMKDEKASYFDLLTQRDLAHFLAFLPEASGTRHYKLIQRIGDYPAIPDPHTIYVIAAIEGGHNFYRKPKLDEQEQPSNVHEIVDQLKIWKQQSVSHPEQFPRLLYITMAHHGQNALANHAWAIPLRFASGTVSVGSFDPTGNGLSKVGEAFLRTALSEEGGQKRILIDIKHLGLASRKRVYEIMATEFAGVPILATHMGVTGRSWDSPPLNDHQTPTDRPQQVIVSYQPVGGFLRRMPPDNSGKIAPKAIPFNPWSINLYDEDIIQIMRSGGLIGISMDRRILGATDVEEERFSRADIPAAWLTLPRPTIPPNGQFYPSTPLPKEFDNVQSKAQQDLWAFCQQIIHIVLITELAKGNTDPQNNVPATTNPWDHLCLGSDFDGLVSALKTCPTTEQLPNFFGQKMQGILQAMANHLNMGGVLSTPMQVPADVIERLSVKNGLTFLKAHYQ